MKYSCLTLSLYRGAARAIPRHRAKRRLPALAGAMIILGGLPSLAAGATLHVDQNNAQCTNSGSGTEQQPFCTIGAAAGQVAAGDTVLVQSGIYNEAVTVPSSGTSGAPIVFNAVGAVTVTGQARGFDLSGRNWITVQGFMISNTSKEGIRALLVENLTISGNQVINAGDVGIEVRDCADVTLSDNLVQGSAADGIYIKFCDSVTVTGNEVTGAGLPVSGEVQKGIQLNATINSLLSDNLAEANSDHGIYVAGDSTGIHIKGNISRDNAREYARAATGIEVRGSSGNTVEGNITHDNEDSGMNIRSEANNNLVVNNLSYNNGDHGIDHLTASNGRIIGNSVYNNFKKGLEIEGNSVGLTIANNIAVDNGLTTNSANIETSDTSVQGSTADHNVVFGGGVLYTWNGVDYASLDDLRAATGMETNGIEADPLWVAPGSGDFRLSAGSPAIDSADSGVSGALAHDLDGNARTDDPGTPNTGAGPRAFDDRGAYEFGGTSPPNTPPEITSGPTADPNQLFSNETAALSVTATDADNDPLDYTWTPEDGSIQGSGPNVTYVPPAVTETQTFTIEVEVSDGRGGTDTGTVDVTVDPASVPPNNPPEITSGPTAVPNQLFSNETAELSVTATDADNDPLGYNWIVPPGGGSINGTGPIVTYLPPALTATQAFTISVEVTDPFGGLAEGSVEVTVDPAPQGDIVSFRPVADAWVNEASPDQNFGGTNRLNVDGRAINTAFLRFDVTGLTAPVQSAWIEIEVVQASSDGGTIHGISDNTWGEFTITFNNQPTIDGPALDSTGPVSVGAILQLDVTSAINQDGQYNFAIVGDGSDGWSVRSREGSANTPMLFVEMGPTS